MVTRCQEPVTPILLRLLIENRNIPAEYRKSLTWDRGMVLAKHADLIKEFGMPVYFYDLKCTWQQSTNENTNGLIR